MIGRRQRWVLVAAALAVVLFVGACTGADGAGHGEQVESRGPVCGVFDPAEMRQATGVDVSFVDLGEPDPSERSWQCTVEFPEGGESSLRTVRPLVRN